MTPLVSEADTTARLQKLKPFFPPLDQVQSINLRAALLRALDQAKKIGALGRDAILRKTMLDECKGERLEEVLAAFSAAVLKRVASDDIVANGEHPALAAGLAFENLGYKDEKTELVALTLAHRASLCKLLDRKKAANARYRDFADLLGIKDRGLARRNEQLLANQDVDSTKTVSDDARLEMRRTVRNNWAGNERWMETLMCGDASAAKGGLLATPFDRVWRRVQQGRLAELEESGSGLLEQLDTRVRVQKERLRRWDAFRRTTFGEQPRASPSKAKPSDRTKGIDLGFGAHENLHTGKMSPSKATIGTREPKMNDTYASLIRGMKEELDIQAEDANPLEFLKRWKPSRDDRAGTSLSLDSGAEETISEMSELEDDDMNTFPAEAPIRSFQAKLNGARRLPIRPTISYSDEASVSQKSSSRSVPTKPPADYERDYQTQTSVRPISRPISSDNHVSASQSPDLSPHQSPAREDSPIHVPPAPQQEPIQSPTQDMADQILESMNSTSPSPTKSKQRHTLSLAERTRLSMARGSSAFLADDEPELPLGPSAGNAPTPVFEGDSKTLVDDEPEDLASRTRRSMVGFEKAQQKAQMERRRSLRRSKVAPRKEGSYFPKMEEETQDQSMLEDLGEDDFEAIFKSRPKIKASPIPSPTKEWDMED